MSPLKLKSDAAMDLVISNLSSTKKRSDESPVELNVVAQRVSVTQRRYRRTSGPATSRKRGSTRRRLYPRSPRWRRPAIVLLPTMFASMYLCRQREPTVSAGKLTVDRRDRPAEAACKTLSTVVSQATQTAFFSHPSLYWILPL